LITVILALLGGTLLMRLMMQGVVWPFVYGDERMSLHFLGLLARYFYSLLDLVQIAGIAVSIKFYKLKVESIKKEKNLILEKSKAEVLHLKAQTNPHFLFNTLNSIYSLARSKSEQTAEVVMGLSKLLRYTLYDTGHRTVTIGEELKIINSYIELQQLRFSNRVVIDFIANVDSDSTQIAPLLLLPVIENAYKHCDESNARIEFYLNLKNDLLSLKTSNPVSVNGDISRGSGLANLNRQLDLLYKKYNLDYFIKDKHFVLNLNINLDSYAGNELFNS
jgi:LytS/YehU family sensor histidine kinase